MLVLSATTDRIQIALAATVATNQVKCVASWRDITATPTYVAGRTVVLSNNTTDVDVVASPAASTQRLVDFLSVFNDDTAAVFVTIKFDANGTDYVLWEDVIEPGQRVEFTSEKGFPPSRQASLTIRLDEGATYTYVGEAVPGTAHAAASWRVKRITNADTTVLFADGNSNFDNVWNDRATLSYA